ncbi:hypothetical protein BJ138DRAFT_1127797 [Hygrophoropsis aurantiaca]|uniref:Uncharacterized protein n=1 Tax=Hygrophoropsis aurantiaca TaxID=72124 RepID=A0ACB8A7V6_9AGAM|nr:hypothetical protein BJ138DRAFT_1127797 [Hygrophoropsis aurantiaca]
MPIRHRSRRPANSGDTDTAVNHSTDDHKDDPYGGDEYEALLKYAHDEAEKAEHAQGNVDQDDDTTMVRLWYAPWKKVKKGGKAEKRVPPDWLRTDIKQGLTGAEADKRRSAIGYNELESQKENQFLKFIGYFRGPILYVMEIAVILAAGLRDWIDFGVIIAILLLNASVGWYQEKQAGDIVAQLKAGIALRATAIRDGREKTIEARDLVPGDVVVIEEGNTIPADAKARIVADYSDKDGSKSRGLLEKNERADREKEATGGHNDNGKGNGNGRNNGNGKNNTDGHGDSDSDSTRQPEEAGDDEEMARGPSVCSVDQSAITGESLAVEKYIGDIAYYTCGIKRGKVIAVVQMPAPQSFVGRTAALVLSSHERGHFQAVLGGIGTTLLVMVIVFIFIVWIGGFFRSIGIASPQENNLLVYALIFFIIGVPVGLPCVTTTTMAVGAAYLARRKAIVQKLTAIESLAGVDMLCSDKTGTSCTLTANKLSLNQPYIAEGVEPAWFMTVAVLASSHNIKSLDPIDKVTIVGLKDYPKAQECLRGGWKTLKFTPFDPVSKRITAEVEKDGKRFTCAKGAPNAILKLSGFSQSTVEHYREMANEFAQRGFRSLGIACKEQDKDWQLLGLMAMSDPPRPDTAATIAEAINLGIHIKMLTGDAVAIAKETCKQLSLGTNVFDSQRLMGGGMKGTEVFDFVEAADGFAEVFPEHKYQVVDMLQQRGHLTAMTGDGVNDAPSLKKADCGIAVQGASDAARSAADVVFLDEGLSTIITSIKVARQIFHRMKAYIVYRIALCIHLEVYLMLSMLILNETIRVDLIVFIAIFADIATLAIAYDNAPYARKPVDWQLPKVWIISSVMGLLLAAGTWIMRGTLFLVRSNDRGGIVQNFGSIQEILFLEVALTESWVIFITRLSQGPDSGGFEWPSFQLLAAVLGVDVLATVFALFGWISGAAPHAGWTDIVTIVRIWLYSFGVIIVITMVYMLMNTFKWLDRVGRPSRHRKNERLENFIAELQHMTLVHERDQAKDSYHLAPASPSEVEGGGGSGTHDPHKGGGK